MSYLGHLEQDVSPLEISLGGANEATSPLKCRSGRQFLCRTNIVPVHHACLRYRIPRHLADVTWAGSLARSSTMPGKVRRWEDMFSKTQILKTADYFGVFTIYSAFFVWLLILSILSI